MEKYILLLDRVGERSESGFGGMFRRAVGRQSTANVLKGELLEKNHGDTRSEGHNFQKPLSYRLVKDPSVTVYCSAGDIAPLSDKEFLLLEAIQSLSARYEVFIVGNKLEWGCGLKPGDPVYVIVPGRTVIPNRRTTAVIRYFGGLPPEEGLMFGVEITDEQYCGHGTTDGTFRDLRYFACKEKCGLFVPLDKLSKNPDGSMYTREKAARGGQSYASVDYKNKPHPTDSIDLGNTSTRAKEMGISKKQLMADQKAVLREAEKSKAAQELKQEAVPDQSFDLLAAQRAALHAFRKDDSETRSSLPPRGECYTDDSVHLRPRPPQIQHSYEPVNSSPSQRKHLGSQTKSASLARREQIYTRVDSQGYQQKPSHEYAQPHEYAPREYVHSQPFPQNLSDQQLPRLYEHPQSEHPLQQPPYKQPLQHQPPPQWLLHHPQQLPQPPLYQQLHQAFVPDQHQVHQSLTIGSTVQLVTFSDAGPQQPRYGVIRWIGEITGVTGTIAGVELEDPMEGCADGTFQMTGQKYFDCPDGRGLFFPLVHLKPDERFTDPGATPAVPANPLVRYPLEERADQTVMPNQMEKYVGDERGIQGHQNSCYLDATVFGLFALSEAFDSIFLPEAKDAAGKEIRSILQKDIVNPLRKNGAVRFESVMRLRNKLEELGKMKGIAQDEKDPEEFLNMLFKHTLHVEPFIRIRRPFGTEQEYFVQLFLEYDESMKLPSVGDLLTKMFKEQKISFTELPSKLLIQVPRFGRQFKTYQKIIADLNLDIMHLTDSPNPCFICGESARLWCAECMTEFQQLEDPVHFCLGCSESIHGRPHRIGHKVDMPQEAAVRLELLSVICIETSQHISFTRAENRWIFFDSMANRVYDMYNIPKGVDCTQELNEWVYSGNHQRLLDTPPRELPEYVRRFTQDIYMCVYISPDAGMYEGGPSLADYQPVKSKDQLKKEKAEVERIPDERYKTLETQLSQAQREKQDLQERQTDLEQQLQKERQDTHQYLQELQQQMKQERQQMREERRQIQEENRQFERQLQEQISDNQNLHRHVVDAQSEAQKQALEKQDLQERHTHLEQQLQHLEQQLRRERQQTQEEKRQLERQLQEQIADNQSLHRQVIDAQTEARKTQLIQPQGVLEDIECWKVPRSDVRVVKEIGVGAWGSVSEGKYKGQPVAVKQPHRAILTPPIVERLQREVQIMAQVRHPNLVRFIAAVFDDKVQRLKEPPMIVLELLDMNLRAAYERDVVGASQIPIFRDVAYGLHYLHEHQDPIIHRDISSPNVLLEALPQGAWKAKVSDFGSANLEKRSKTAGEGAIIYSAPETFPHTDPTTLPPPQTTKIDVFSYGILLCEVITKQLPEDPTKYRSMLQHVQSQWPYMYDLIVSCTKRDPNERPTMAQVLDQLNKLPRPRFRQRS